MLCLGRNQYGRPLATGNKEGDPQEPFNETAFLKHKKGAWPLKTSIIGNYCISHPESQFSTSVWNLTCLGQKLYNDPTPETQCGELQITQNPSPTHWPTSLIAEILEQSYPKHRLAGAQEAILDLWEASLYSAT
jgi:hypothetical protein